MRFHAGRALGAAMILFVLAGCTPAAPAIAPTAVAPVAKPTGAVNGQPEPAKPDSAAAQRGQQLAAQKGCGGCHIIPGVAGANGVIGPTLAGIANRSTIAGGTVPNNGPADLERWIMNPPAVKPGTQMPNMGLSEEEVRQIVAYLQTLQ